MAKYSFREFHQVGGKKAVDWIHIVTDFGMDLEQLWQKSQNRKMWRLQYQWIFQSATNHKVLGEAKTSWLCHKRDA